MQGVNNKLNVRVKVTPSASKEVFKKVGDDKFEIYVKEPAQKNMANKRVLALVEMHYGAPPKAARIMTGHKSRNKLIEINL